MPLIEPIRSMLLAWKVQSGLSEWIFPNRKEKPLQMEGFQKRVIGALF